MDQSALEILAPAKLNLYLGVREGRDEQGYHQASSLMVAIDLFDTVRIEPADALSVRCVPAVDAPERSNAAWKAAVVLGEALGREPKVAITIEKRIPYKSG
ncbi:MAG: 4-diphosphocytidyl-2C-methyl-D-erythritol kinase, partial [Atopobiaceae bacterium]|nr:4-diphosphocytidyl-2C-methyl-D-erythritol kinase [Atopobiaceae bacterium]